MCPFSILAVNDHDGAYAEMSAILQLINNYPPAVGGAEKLAESLVAEYQAQGQTTIVVTRLLPGTSLIERSRQGTIYRVPVFGPQAVRSLLFRLFSAALLLILRDKYRCIHAHALDAPAQLASSLGPLLGKPVVVTIHNVGKVRALAKRVGGQATLSRIIKNCSAIVSINPAIAEELLEHSCPQDKIVTILNGVDTERFSRTVEVPSDSFASELRSRLSGRVLVLFVGVFQHQKGIDVLLRAWRELLNRAPIASAKPMLIIAGSGSSYQEMVDLAQELKLDSSVEFLGMRNDVAHLLQVSDVFVQPSRWEGLSIALLEALSSEATVVATSVEGNADVLTDRVNSLTVPVEDVSQLANALETVGNDPQLRHRLAIAGRQTVLERYSLKSCALAHLRLFDSLSARDSERRR